MSRRQTRTAAIAARQDQANARLRQILLLTGIAAAILSLAALFAGSAIAAGSGSSDSGGSSESYGYSMKGASKNMRKAQGLIAAGEFAGALGYLEADPNLDVGGIDAAHKLALLSSIAFASRVNFDAVETEGIGSISIDDINRAADMGFRIKLLGVAQMTCRGLEQRMSPCLVPANSPLGQLESGNNMVVLEGDNVGQIVLQGAGAGEGPTASAVLSDIVDIARGTRISTFGQPATHLAQPATSKSQTPASFYLRMHLFDKPGALAKVADVLGEWGVSIDRMRQYGHVDETAPVLIVTHKAHRKDLDGALSALPKTDVLQGVPVALRIEEV